MVEPVESHYVWRPLLRDANDEMVLEAAVNGRANAIVTFNTRDFGSIPPSFGIHVLLPRAAFRMMNTATYFAEARKRTDPDAFRQLLQRSGGVAPRDGDERA